MTLLLRRRGYDVQSADSLHSALQIAAGEDFDVLISDIGLPDGTGIELMQELIARRPFLGIALSGFGMEDDIRKSLEVGFNHHLIKPVTDAGQIQIHEVGTLLALSVHHVDHAC